MQILIISEFYSPDPAAGRRVAEAASTLAMRGHRVRVLARGGWGAAAGSTDPAAGVLVERLWTPDNPGFGLLRKGFATMWFQVAAFLRALTGGDPFDVLLTVSTPPLCHVFGAIVCGVRGARHAFWCADVHPQSAIRLGILARTSLAARFLSAVNRWGLLRCDAVIAVGRCMKALLVELGAPGQRVVIVPMWHRDGLAEEPDSGASETARVEAGLDGKFVVMYSGNLGRVHEFETLPAAAERLKDAPDFAFLFCGSGPALDRIRRAAEGRLPNIRFRSPFPEDRLAEGLAMADVHVITLRNNASGISVPGKLYGAMASGRPIVFIGPATSEAAITVVEERCGFVIRPGDALGVVEILQRLRTDVPLAAELGRNARAAFLARHCQSRRCDQFANAIESLEEEVGERAAAVT